MKIVCAVDGSEYSKWTVEALRILAADPPETLCLLHSVEPHLPKSAGSPSPARISRVVRALDEHGGTLLRNMSGLAPIALGRELTRPERNGAATHRERCRKRTIICAMFGAGRLPTQ